MSLKPVHALVGGDIFLQLEKLQELQRLAGKESQRIDVDGETAQLGDVLDELRSFAMFSSSKFMAVRNADDFVSRFREQLEEYCQQPSASSVLVLRLSSLPKNQRIYKQISAVGQVHDCEPPRNLGAWIIDRGKKVHKLTVKPDAAELLKDLIGADLGRLDNELAKLALQTQGTVDAAAVSSVVAFQRDQEMFDMTNEVAAGNIAEALRRWRQLCQLDTSAEFRAVTWLGMWLEDVRTFLNSPGAFKNAWKYREKLPQFKKTATALGPTTAGRLVEALAEVDFRSKQGLGDMKDNVESFLLSIGK
jgi:DNA polymerase III delta subunit